MVRKLVFLVGISAAVLAIALIALRRTSNQPTQVPEETVGNKPVAVPKAVDKKPVVTKATDAPNPLPKPTQFPDALSTIQDAQADERLQLQQIRAVAETESIPATAATLRWLLHEAKRDEVVRNEAAKVLIEWKDPRFVQDAARMMRDSGHSDKWRAYCIQYLETYYVEHGDSKALDLVKEAARSEDQPLRNQGVFSLASVAEEKDWAKSDPDELKELIDVVRSALASKNANTVTCALRATSRANLTDLAPDAERLAGDANVPSRIRIAAVQALGQIGRPQSTAVLQTCAKSSDGYLNRFARISLKLLAEAEKE